MRWSMIALAAMCAGAPLRAQVPFNGCVDRAGVPIVGTVNNGIPGGAEATRVDNKPVIYWNRGNMQWARPATQLFVYLHECGHHALGHIYKPNDPKLEQEADCWAMELLIDGAMISGDDEGALESDLIHNFPGDGFHLSGEATVRGTRECMASRTDPAKWRVALDSLVAGVPDSLARFVGQRMFEFTDLRYESRLDLPGIFDCELNPQRTFRCPVYTGTSQRRAKGRWEAIAKIIRDWLPPRWTVAETAPKGYVTEQLMAEDGMTGARITLALTDHHTVFFVFQPYTE